MRREGKGPFCLLASRVPVPLASYRGTFVSGRSALGLGVSTLVVFLPLHVSRKYNDTWNLIRSLLFISRLVTSDATSTLGVPTDFQSPIASFNKPKSYKEGDIEVMQYLQIRPHGHPTRSSLCSRCSDRIHCLCPPSWQKLVLEEASGSRIAVFLAW